MGFTTKIYLKNDPSLLKRVRDLFINYDEFFFYDFSKYSEMESLVISSDLSDFVIDTYEEPSHWLENPIDVDNMKDTASAFIVNKMSNAVHPFFLRGLTDLLTEGESVYLIHHHERGDNNYDDLMMEIKHNTWDCHLNGYEGQTLKKKIFHFSDEIQSEEFNNGYNQNYINEKLKINLDLLIKDDVNTDYLNGHYDIDDLDLTEV